jgi:fatty-acyl-CoA synthase
MNQHFARKEDSASQAWLRALELTARIEIENTRTFPVVVEELGARFGDAPALITRRETLSHSSLAARANRIARWTCAQGIRKGDTVALLMPNCPDFLAIWLGITRVGGSVALLNTHLKGEALAHGIRVASPRLVIAAEHLADRISGRARIWRYGPEFCKLLECFSGAPLAASEQRDVTLNDCALLIYTSSTTGLPKATHVSHRRVMNWTHWFAGMMDAGPQDRLFNCLPMYHGIGGVVAPGAALVGGGSVICREKFSAAAFWDDVAESRATIFPYIGELCRHLLAGGAPKPEHNLRLAVGNGLSGDIWQVFQDRFAIPRTLEFYASTEGNFSLCNVEGKAGSIGRVPAFLEHRFGIALVKLDVATGRPARGNDGLCIAAARGETGEALGRIGDGLMCFEGNADAGATEEKVLRDVFMSGDAWLRSGDLMRQDAQGFFYVVERTGDTIRRKGENVATTEVATAAAGAQEVKIFGIPGEIRSMRL